MTGIETWLAPIITGIFALIVGVVGGIMARRGQKLGNRESKAPDVQDLWYQQESDRRMRQLIEDLWWNLRRAFQSYYRRVSNLALRMSLTPDEQKSFELTPKELAAIEAKPPEEEA